MALEARTNRDIIKVQGAQAALLAQFAQDTSLDHLEQYRVIPMVKIIQSMTRDEIKTAAGGEGNVVLSPGLAPVAKLDTSFLFVPQLCYTEFLKWRDLEDQSDAPIMERSQDPSSPLALKCRDPKTFKEPYANGSKHEYRNSEHINYVGVIFGEHPLAGTTITLSYARGEFNTGKTFSTSCSMRKATLEDNSRVRVPLWAQVWEMKVGKRVRGTRKWFGLDAVAPTSGESMIPADMMEAFQAAHTDLKALLVKDLLRPSYDPDTIAEPGEGGGEAPANAEM